MTSPTRVLLIGWDAADWKIINPLLDSGKMPNLEKLINKGVMGNLATIYPDLSPMLWTSIATGKRPYKHGIHGFTEPDFELGGVRPVSNSSRNTRALWNILNGEGLKTHVVGWWPSHPVESVDGTMVSNHYHRATVPAGHPWPLPPGTVHPERIARNLADLRVHPQAIEPGLLLNFLPDLARIDQDRDRRVGSVAKIIAECTSVYKAAAAVMHHETWDCTAVYFDAIDHFCHGFMNYHPPKLSWVSDDDFSLYRHVVEAGYIYHDIMLGWLLDRTDSNTHVLLVSDHGFASGDRRPYRVPDEPGGPAHQHRHYGIFVMAGPGIRKDERVYGASLLDVCPTILTLFGLPVGEDMDGKVLADAWETPPEVATLPTWDIGDFDQSMAAGAVDPRAAKAALEQLVALGYVEAPDEDQDKAARKAVTELNYNLARSYMDANRHLDAIPLLESLVTEFPHQHRFQINLVTCLLAVGELARAREILTATLLRRKEEAEAAVEELAGVETQYEGQKQEHLPQPVQRRVAALSAKANPMPHGMAYLMGTLLMKEGQLGEALRHFEIAGKTAPNLPEVHVRLGEACLAMMRPRRALEGFAAALELDSEHPGATLGRARAHFQLGLYDRAADDALTAVGLIYHNPIGHYVLGCSLAELGVWERAVQALTVAVAQNPNFPEARERLRELSPEAADSFDEYTGRPLAENPSNDESHRGDTSKTVIPVMDPDTLSRTTVIVSGLPRSGTSMLMQMLAAGGMPVLTDGARLPDADNPRGYFEYEKTKSMGRDAAWLGEARGRAVKIVAPLLTPEVYRERLVRVIFMDRDMGAVMRSQKAMLERLGEKNDPRDPDSLARVFQTQVNQLVRQFRENEVPVLRLDYDAVIDDPGKAAESVNQFHGGALDSFAMACAVDSSLRRQKSKS